MARIENGILGAFSGKVGEVIGSSWNGIPYIKSRPASFHDAKTPAQLAHRMKLQVAHRFIKSVKECIEVGFRQISEHQSPYNKAVSYIMKNAVMGEYPSMHIEPSKVVLSQGNLADAKESSASKNEKGEIAFSWDVNRLGENDFLKEKTETQSTLQVDDTAWLVAYNFSKQEAKTARQDRDLGHATIEIPDDWNGDEIGCYIFFSSNKDNKVSDSQFLGVV